MLVYSRNQLPHNTNAEPMPAHALTPIHTRAQTWRLSQLAPTPVFHCLTHWVPATPL